MCYLPATALQQLVFIPDEAFKTYSVPENDREHVFLDFYPSKTYSDTILIAPHHHEAWLNIHLFKLALHCRINNIKLISIGHENQLPFFGMFSDAVILQRGHLNDLFGWFSAFSTNTRGFNKLPHWRDIYRHEDWKNIYADYSAEHVVAVFSDCNIFLRQKSREIFELLNTKNELPRDAIWCEVKERFGKFNARLTNLLTQGLPLAGLDKSMQKKLVAEHGSHFMALQILSSLLNKCRLLCCAGSAHVFAVAPSNLAFCIGAADKFYNRDAEYVVRKHNLHRFGSVPYLEEATLNWMCTEDVRQFSAAPEDEGIAHWQVDYFADESFIKAQLLAAMAVEPRARIAQISWTEYLKQETNFDSFLDHRLSFTRADNTHIMDLTLFADGSINPHSDNERYWTKCGNYLWFKNSFGQTTTEFEYTNSAEISGHFIYNDLIKHKLRVVR